MKPEYQALADAIKSKDVNHAIEEWNKLSTSLGFPTNTIDGKHIDIMQELILDDSISDAIFQPFLERLADEHFKHHGEGEINE